MGITPHFSARDDRPAALARVFHDEPGFAISIRKRMRIEEVMGFGKMVGGLLRVKVQTAIRVLGVATMAGAAYNLTRHATLTAP